ncbi:hypothetical protein CRG98_009525 [Punica granatum]|uniref:Uncharacterized protein n=1 Tax=Punica granatum TaxID=22663 RepID=A0A2I0KNL0_PUNGR|nr:hypothetical protein CRG98_009525 [Punica granatum]
MDMVYLVCPARQPSSIDQSYGVLKLLQYDLHFHNYNMTDIYFGLLSCWLPGRWGEHRPPLGLVASGEALRPRIEGISERRFHSITRCGVCPLATNATGEVVGNLAGGGGGR